MNEKAQNIRLLAMDVDGVLTAGGIIYSDSGEELKVFNILDGLGLVAAVKSGLKTAIITGRTSGAVERRANELQVTYLVQGCRNKGAAVRRLMEETGLTREQVAFVGDDLNDALAFREAGWRVAVRNASKDMKAQADYVTKQRGGEGALREVVELILESQGKWADAVQNFISDLEQSR